MNNAFLSLYKQPIELYCKCSDDTTISREQLDDKLQMLIKYFGIQQMKTVFKMVYRMENGDRKLY